jgi:hypothetical protein
VYWNGHKPVALPSLGAQRVRILERARDVIMAGLGTADTFFEIAETAALNYRKPLRIDEINQLPAHLPMIRTRPGRA